MRHSKTMWGIKTAHHSGNHTKTTHWDKCSKTTNSTTLQRKERKMSKLLIHQTKITDWPGPFSSLDSKSSWSPRQMPKKGRSFWM
jgi:hypothetical protein